MDKCCKTCEHYKCDTYCNSDNHKGVLVPSFTVCPDYKEKPIDNQVKEFIEQHKDDILRILAAEYHTKPAVWIHSVSTAGGIWDKYDCSNCGHRIGHTRDYCPNCGAKMEGYDYDTKRKRSS